MDDAPDEIWVAACAHRLQLHWRTVDPLELERVAGELWRDPKLRSMPPAAAVDDWLEPIASVHVQSLHL